MPNSARDIRRRLRSIKSTAKITKAMELVSAAKMRRAVASVLASRPYAQLAWEAVRELQGRLGEPGGQALMQARPVRAVALVLISSNRGLCGSFNAQVSATALRAAQEHLDQGRSVEVVSFGRKGREQLQRQQLHLAADFPKADLTTSVADLAPLARLLVDDFQSGRYDQVLLAYTDFVSSLKQRPRMFQLLPLGEPDPALGGTARQPAAAVSPEAIGADQGGAAGDSEFLFEPDAATVLTAMLPRVLEAELYQAVLESEASEHSARMLAMRNATDAAHDMLDDLTLSYNQVRQSGITQEIAEISAGRSALEST